ncbi:MAG: FAD-dependent oxidoreductase [Pseudomonadales bacterium]|nr:FAD-dependent oxidoreductase [Pseudomonadales bacterium]
MIKKIGIIGAGYGGISSARILKAFGFEVIVFEKERELGGVWVKSRRYPSVTTQNPKDTYNLSEMPMPKSYPEWPNGAQVQAYLESYAKKFGIIKHIQLCSEVTQASITPKTGTWRLEVRNSGIISETVSESIPETKTKIVEVDFLLVCNGVFSKPFIQSYPGSDKFRAAGGQLLHTSEFNDVALARDKNVVITGYGKSSCDVARACMDTSATTTVVVRNLIWKIPKRILKVINFKYLLLNRLGESLFRYTNLKGFEKFLHSRFGSLFRNLLFRMFEGIISWQLRLETLALRPSKSFETIGNATISLVSEGFYEGVQKGKIKFIKEASIVELRACEAVLDNNEVLKADIVLCGTGWKQQVPFFDKEIISKITDTKGNFRLYRSILPTAVPNLAFNGYGSSLMCQLNCEVGALWIADLLKGGLSLPPDNDLENHITERLAWMEKRTGGKHCKGTNLIPFTLHHLDELLEDLDLTLSPLTLFKQWFVVANPGDYKHLLNKLKERYAL